MIGIDRKREIAIRDERIAMAYRAGDLMSAIAVREGVSRPLVSLIIKKAGARLPPEEALARCLTASRSPSARRKAAEANHRPIADRFFEKVTKGRQDDDCWDWLGSFDGAGYPQIYYEGRNRKATHISLMLDGRPRPDDLNALHTCDNPRCTNPKHLWWGTQGDNIKDANAKGRLNLTGLALGLPARLGIAK